MELAARRYARKVLIIHIAALLLLLIVVGLAVTFLYRSARAQAISHASETQQLLAKQTALGVANYYESVTGVMDLLQPGENEPTTAPAHSNRPSTRGPNARELRQRALQSGPLRRMLSGMGQGMWDSINNKATMLFVVDSEEDFEIVTILGDRDAVLNPDNILTEIRPWLSKLKNREVSEFVPFESGGAHVVAVPMRGPGGLVMLCVVPVASLERDVLRYFSRDLGSKAMLVDNGLRIVSAVDTNLAGTSVDDLKDARAAGVARKYINLNQGGTEVVDYARQYSGVTYPPAMMTIQPANVLGQHWLVLIASSLDEVDAIVNPIFRDAMLWAGFVMLAMTAILVSTAMQLIRTRVNLERQQMARLNHEMAQARQIQLNWLPTQPCSFKSIEIAAVNKPASHVSGDFYNWFELSDGRVAIVIGDVTGHGMAAAFLMATTQFLIRALMQRLSDPGRVLAETNRQISTMVFSGQFVTALLMVLDAEKREMLYANAGHFRPLIYEDGKFHIADGDSDLVLGVETSQEYRTYRTLLPPNANLLLYTDGVVEAESISGERFSTDGLIERLNGTARNPDETVKKVIDIVNNFTGGVDLEDDLTLVAIRMSS